MTGKGEVVVTVTRRGKRLECDHPWVRLFWETGPDEIRWVFEGLDAGAEAEVRFLRQVPTPKHPPLPPGVDLLPSGAHERVDKEAGKPVPDRVARGNLKKRGVFFFDVAVRLADGTELHLDPGGTNDPTSPPTNYP